MKTDENTPVKNENGEPKSTTNLLVILMAVIFIALSALMLFMPEANIKPEYIIYVVGGVVIIIGIVLIVRYFITDAYKNMNEYGFSAGTLCVILGICVLLRAAVIAGVIDLFLGTAVLLMGVIMLQHSLDIKRMGDAMWGLVIVLAVLSIICGVGLILKPAPEKIEYSSFTWWVVLVVSAIGLIVNLYTMIRIALYKRKENKKPEHPAEPEAVSENSGSGDTSPVPAQTDYSAAEPEYTLAVPDYQTTDTAADTVADASADVASDTMADTSSDTDGSDPAL
ncbi:MAG: DUF308 domain-containing protein [Lachnospiraceae bacterium]|nr:DUF308 domain-containing protein [Lachnospiraceae bacterium]